MSSCMIFSDFCIVDGKLLRFYLFFNVQGNILYRFPSLQRTASSKRTGRKEYVGKRWAEWVGGIDKFFRERKWEFRFS